jgi:Flp pilus assembly protein TadB
VPADEKTNVQGLSDSVQNLAGATGGAISGSIVALSLFTGLNMAALVPVALLIVLSALITRYRSKHPVTQGSHQLPLPMD